MEEYYVIEVIVAEGVTKYLIIQEDSRGTMTVLGNKWPDKKGAVDMCEYLNRG